MATVEKDRQRSADDLCTERYDEVVDEFIKTGRSPYPSSVITLLPADAPDLGEEIRRRKPPGTIVLVYSDGSELPLRLDRRRGRTLLSRLRALSWRLRRS